VSRHLAPIWKPRAFDHSYAGRDSDKDSHTPADRNRDRCLNPHGLPGTLSRFFWITRVSGYLNTPPITEAKKINTVAKSNPATIFFLSATPRRAAGLRSCRRGSNLEDRNFYYGA
jgi:hypothetical protein